MSDGYLSLDTRESQEDIWVVMRREPSRGKPPGLRSEYQDLACGRCGKYDLLAALERGIGSDVAGPGVEVDAVTSNDRILLVSARCRGAFEQFPGLEAQFFPLPGDPRYHVMHPTRVFRPPEGARVYKPTEPALPGDAFQVRSHPCRKCGRHLETTFRPEWFSVPGEMHLGAAHVEVAGENSAFFWLASSAVASLIQRNQLTGWWIHPIRRRT